MRKLILKRTYQPNNPMYIEAEKYPGSFAKG